MAINKKDALAIVYHCAEEYQKHLVGNHLLFVFTDKHKNVECLEVTFDISSFLHLTGFVVDDISAADFFERCLHKRLKESDFSFKPHGETELKLRVLPALITKNLSAKMIGDYNMLQPKLYTEKMAGNTSGCMGFVRNNGVGRYVPNTVLNEDIRDRVVSANRIIAAFRKKRTDSAYTELVYLAKRIDWDRLSIPEEYTSLLLPLKESAQSD